MWDSGTETGNLRLAVLAYLDAHRVTLRGFAEQVQISHSTLSRILHGKQDPTADTVQRIEAGLRLEPVERAPSAIPDTHGPERTPSSLGLLRIAALVGPFVIAAALWLRTTRQDAARTPGQDGWD
jgi:transcriptional regulator with XRE-family HTH domain